MNFVKRMGKKRIAVFSILFLLLVTAIILISTLPLSSFSSNGFTFFKMDNGTYRITKYSGKESYVEIPRTVRGVEVTEIMQFAFENNPHIKTVVVHDNIEKIGLGAFKGCTSLESLTVPFVGGSNDHNLHLAYIFSDHVGLALDSTPVPKSLRFLYITKGCTKISTSAFYLCSDLDEIHIPSTVTTIDDGTGYTSIGVNGHLPSSRETYLPFYGCSKNLRIYCASSKKPEEWGTYWNYINSSDKAMVFWSSKEY